MRSAACLSILPLLGVSEILEEATLLNLSLFHLILSQNLELLSLRSSGSRIEG